MRCRYKARIEDVISELNQDVLLEISMSDECIRRADAMAQPHWRLRRQVESCAAAALSNATALAAEVLSLGGMPPVSAPGPRSKTHRLVSIEEWVAQAQFLLAHYEKRLAMAERLRLPRLRSVIQDIIKTKRSHALHAAVIAAAGARARQLS